MSVLFSFIGGWGIGMLIGGLIRAYWLNPEDKAFWTKYSIISIVVTISSLFVRFLLGV